MLSFIILFEHFSWDTHLRYRVEMSFKLRYFVVYEYPLLIVAPITPVRLAGGY